MSTETKEYKTQTGFTLWFTGLSGSGKSTVAELLKKKLNQKGLIVEVLDGDEVRTHLSKGLGFSKEDRDANIRRIGYVASLLSRNSVIAITAAISPYKEIRNEVRELHDNFVEIYAKCPIEELEKRDVKGLYKKAKAGEIKQFTGISDPYEEPLNPEIIIETDKQTPEESTEKILTWLKKHNYILSLFLFFFVSLFLLSQNPVFAENKPVIRPKVGIALGGGGARGTAHIGVLRVLEKENIPIDYLVGTSTGALIAALYSGGVPPDELEKYVLTGAIRKVYKTDFSIIRAIFLYLNKTLRTFLGKPFYAGLYNDHRLHHFVNQLISKEDGSINIAVPLHVIAVDLISGQPVVIKSGDVGLAVQASTAIPTLRQPIPIDDQLLVDGGVINNIPVEEAKKMGADFVIAIDVEAKLEEVHPKDFRSFERVITRVINLSLKAQSEYVLEKADIVITPDLKEIGILDLDKESLAEAIKSGEEETIKVIPEIKRKLEERMKAINHQTEKKVFRHPLYDPALLY